VENPVVAAWVTQSLECMKQAAAKARLPLCPTDSLQLLRTRFG
jgi:hypothetical protein